MSKTEEFMADVISCLDDSRYGHKRNDWFFPDDIAPHSSQFKYRCNKLYMSGLLERDQTCGRWGYQYRIQSQKEVE